MGGGRSRRGRDPRRRCPAPPAQRRRDPDLAAGVAGGGRPPDSRAGPGCCPARQAQHGAAGQPAQHGAGGPAAVVGRSTPHSPGLEPPRPQRASPTRRMGRPGCRPTIGRLGRGHAVSDLGGPGWRPPACVAHRPVHLGRAAGRPRGGLGRRRRGAPHRAGRIAPTTARRTVTVTAAAGDRAGRRPGEANAQRQAPWIGGPGCRTSPASTGSGP